MTLRKRNCVVSYLCFSYNRFKIVVMVLILGINYAIYSSSPHSTKHFTNYINTVSNYITGYKKVTVDVAMLWLENNTHPINDTILNQHAFGYIINSKICSKSVDILIVVHTSTDHFENRILIRKTWGSVKVFRNMTIGVVFMLGVTNDREDGAYIQKEARLHGDIVQGAFPDTYRTLTYKHVMGLCWASTHCSGTRTLVKLDDDVFINIYKLVTFSQTFGHHHDSFYCSVWVSAAVERKGKWNTSYDEYAYHLFPTYCQGLGYIVSTDEAEKLCETSGDTPFFWIDDVFVTGILARKAGMKHVRLKGQDDILYREDIHTESNVRVSGHLFYYDFKDWVGLWKRLNKEMS